MLRPTLSPVRAPRTLVHPGPRISERIKSMQSRSGRHIRLRLIPGLSLYDAIVNPLQELGVFSASTTILSCDFDRLSYCVAPPDPTEKVVTIYSAPIAAGAALMIFGNATVGKNSIGRPIVHCHAALRTESGEFKGGHILTDQSYIGATGGVIFVTSLDEFELRVDHDPETNISLLQPKEKAK